MLTEDEYRRLRVAAAGIALSEIARLTVTDVILPAVNPHVSLPVGHVRIAGRGARSRTVTLNLRACDALGVSRGAWNISQTLQPTPTPSKGHETRCRPQDSRTLFARREVMGEVMGEEM